jgi:leucyl/phenylalanyl-tRNA--protein transferase
MKTITWLSPDDPADAFPSADQALREPDGLLAAGGDLSPARLLAAYSKGIFPWYSPGQPVLWWNPDPRAVLFPSEFHRSRSLAKTLRSGRFEQAIDRDFAAVVACCAAPRPASQGTWITSDMSEAYFRLHRLGFAHSVEIYRGPRLVGGLYGVRLGGVFFGESMFSLERDASKMALAHLAAISAANGIALIDCQIPSPHLQRLGSRSLPRVEFLQLLARHVRAQPQGLGTLGDGDENDGKLL